MEGYKRIEWRDTGDLNGWIQDDCMEGYMRIELRDTGELNRGKKED